MDSGTEFVAVDNPHANRLTLHILAAVAQHETPYGMELLATVHWASTDSATATSVDEIVGRVHGWNARKQKIMPAAHIKIAHERLVTEGWCQSVRVNA